ncbi:hypothetical protein [Rhodopila sp.]|uniref:hypothetical protein n=1 Tax=Rhodopila sp. TaxID=2480087 RepID=UPI003D13F89F
MATMVVEIYDALRSIGVAEDKATKAAEAMATLEPQFAVMRQENQAGFSAVRQESHAEFAAMRQESQAEFAAVRQKSQAEFAALRQESQAEFAAVRQEYKAEFADVRQEHRSGFAAVRADLRLVKWQVALLYAITGPTLLLLLRVAAKVGAFG